jgi:hypothetical protein
METYAPSERIGPMLSGTLEWTIMGVVGNLENQLKTPKTHLLAGRHIK